MNNNVVLYENEYFGFQLLEHANNDGTKTYSLISKAGHPTKFHKCNIEDIIAHLVEHLIEQEKNVRQTKILINDIKSLGGI